MVVVDLVATANMKISETLKLRKRAKALTREKTMVSLLIPLLLLTGIAQPSKILRTGSSPMKSQSGRKRMSPRTVSSFLTQEQKLKKEDSEKGMFIKKARSLNP